MPKYRVTSYFETCITREVTADNPDDAKRLAHHHAFNLRNYIEVIDNLNYHKSNTDDRVEEIKNERNQCNEGN